VFFSYREEATNVDRVGAVALEHIICTKGAWGPLDGVGFPEIILTGAWYIWWERRTICPCQEYTNNTRIGVIDRSSSNKLLERT
jgi:hypothetical protein